MHRDPGCDEQGPGRGGWRNVAGVRGHHPRRGAEAGRGDPRLAARRRSPWIRHTRSRSATRSTPKAATRHSPPIRSMALGIVCGGVGSGAQAGSDRWSSRFATRDVAVDLRAPGRAAAGTRRAR
ncbi:MAG: hypothetical protein MZW92_43050 [Comamonadaceae bacterium]|nr:hypothetical protein [Comamonadaceae bacterium]